MRVDSRGNADVVGMTASSDFPTTPDAFQGHNAGGSDIAIAQLDRNGRLRFSSYLGGSGNDEAMFSQHLKPDAVGIDNFRFRGPPGEGLGLECVEAASADRPFPSQISSKLPG